MILQVPLEDSLDRFVSRAMGCFFACFRVRDDRAHTRRQEAAISKNRLSSLFATDGREESPSCNGGGVAGLSGYPRIDKELRDEAMFLKACGTLPETPIEIRVATKKFQSQVPSNTHIEDLKSWQTDLRQLGRESDIAPPPVSPDHSPISCISSVRTTERISISSDEGTEAGYPGTISKINHYRTESSMSFATPMPLTTNTKKREKFVRFQCDLDSSSCKEPSSGKLESQLDLSVSKRSPRPTPLQLSDEMQTPGTVFPATAGALAGGKNRIRSQYVYSEMNPVQDYSRWKVMKEDDSNSDQQLGEVVERGEQLLNPTAKLAADNRIASQISKFGRADGDRPIIGMVAAHWLGNESSDASRKWWDGNGIPNSTTKYKEDQKVSWHATPFEERLEKALSEESVVPQKKQIINGRPIVYDDCEEIDSGLSHIQASAHSKSVVTF